MDTSCMLACLTAGLRSSHKTNSTCIWLAKKRSFTILLQGIATMFRKVVHLIKLLTRYWVLYVGDIYMLWLLTNIWTCVMNTTHNNMLVCI
jgi:hypothetical protein